MRNYFIFLRKELYESLKTYKLLIMGAVFLVFGIISPLTAIMTPDIIRWSMNMDPVMAGMDFSGLLSEPKAIDSWSQFYSNTGLMGLIVLVIVFSGMLSSELSKGTLTIILTKGLSRSAVILAKFTSAALIWTGSLAVSFFTAHLYTNYYFPHNNLPYVYFTVFCLWIFGIFILALTVFSAALTKKNYICMLATGAAVIVLNIINIIPNVRIYNPVTLSGSFLPLLMGTSFPYDVYPAIASAVVFSAALTGLAIFAFNGKKFFKMPLFLGVFVIVSLFLTVFINEGGFSRIKLNSLVVSETVTVGKGTQWELEGILTLPKKAQGKVPAVVLVHGSGPQDMDETIFANKPFRDIAEYLSSNGIAVIRYNKRTLSHGRKMIDQLGGSLSVWEETIEDAILASQILRADPRIDASRIFILGHSLGGMLAPRIHAMGGDFAGLILFAGSPRFLLDIMKDQQAASIEMMQDENEKAYALYINGLFNDRIEAGLLLSDEEAKNTYIDEMGLYVFYFKDMYENPAPMFLNGITVPILVMHGENDLQVSLEKDFNLYRELLGKNGNVTFKLYEGLNHLFMPSSTSNIFELMDEYKKRAKVDGRVLNDIAQWINSY